MPISISIVPMLYVPSGTRKLIVAVVNSFPLGPITELGPERTERSVPSAVKGSRDREGARNALLVHVVRYLLGSHLDQVKVCIKRSHKLLDFGRTDVSGGDNMQIQRGRSLGGSRDEFSAGLC